MRPFATLILLLAPLFAAAQENSPAISDLAWMAGCWISTGEDPTSYVSENWTPPLDMMLATNRTVRDGSVKAYEFLRIEAREGAIYYVARPSGASGETSFKLTTLDGMQATFENPEHDFPTRLVYSLTPEGRLSARVENDEGGFTLVFDKTACEG